MEIQLGAKEKEREREREICLYSSNILILWTIFKANSFLRAPLSRIKTSLHCCQCFFTAGYKYLGNKMKQKPCRVSYLVLAFKYSGKEGFRKKILIVIKSNCSLSGDFRVFWSGVHQGRITGFCPRGEQIFYLLYISISNSVSVNEEPENRMDPQLELVAKSMIMTSVFLP